MHTARLLPVSASMHCAGGGVPGPGGGGGLLPGGVCLVLRGVPASGPGGLGVYPSMQWGRPPPL